jgi:hypothetical protein
MATKGPKHSRYSLREERRRIQRENPPIEIVIDVYDEDHQNDEGYEPGEKVILLPRAETWSDELLGLTKTDQVAAAQLMLSVDDWAAYKAAGGSAMELFKILERENGVDVGESEPSTDG